MEVVFRLPGNSEYSYAEIRVDGSSPMDIMRTLRDVDGAFLSAVGNALTQGCSMVALGALQPQVVAEYDEPAQAQNASYASQEAQAYNPAPQQAYASQNAPQGYGQQPQYQQQAPSGPPPGQQPPICAQHGQPAEYKPAGFSKRTNKPYNAFWACAKGDNSCTRASRFPNP